MGMHTTEARANGVRFPARPYIVMVMPHFIHLLRELEKLQLPKRDFAIFGSAQLAAKEIRDTGDLDIIVRPNLWRELARKYSVKQQGRSLKITIGKIEIYNNWEPWFNDVNILIDKAEMSRNLTTNSTL